MLRPPKLRRQEEGQAMLDRLHQMFPLSFAPAGAEVRPALAIGIGRELLALPELAGHKQAVRQALNLYCGAREYQRAAGSVRIDLADNPAGEVPPRASSEVACYRPGAAILERRRTPVRGTFRC